MDWPRVVYNEEVMREGFGIEDVRIPIEAKIRLLHALSDTGLDRITVGAFVSPRFVPQMAGFEELLQSFRPREGVAYLPFLHNQRAREMAKQYSPPLSLDEESCTLFIDICDAHQRRNVNRSIEQIMALWPEVVRSARDRGIGSGRVAIASAWGSNFLGKFSQQYRFSILEKQMEMLDAAGIPAVEIGLHDSQSWGLPHELESDLAEIRRRWPGVKQIHLHLHDARGMALPMIYVALRNLDSSYTLALDGTLGGIGGGQYCGNGRASRMAATEDVMHMLEGMGIPTGVDLGKLIDCVWMLEEIIGRPAFGHVSKAGPRPVSPSEFYDPNMPGVETLREARHFRLGPDAYADSKLRPWREPISGPYFGNASDH
jgi:hydroxymethylglutaryl-CoA lyase